MSDGLTWANTEDSRHDSPGDDDVAMSVDNICLDELRETFVGAAEFLPRMILDEIFELGFEAKSHVAAANEHWSNPLLVYRSTPDVRDAEVGNAAM